MNPPGTRPDITGVGQTLFGFVRHWSRRWNGPSDKERAERGRDVVVVEAVHAASGRDQATVNDVADELGIDQSGASRMVTQAARRGYIRVTPSPADRRRRNLAVTARGHKLLREAHEWQDAVFAALTDDWTPAERAELHRAMTRLLARSSDLTSGPRRQR